MVTVVQAKTKQILFSNSQMQCPSSSLKNAECAPRVIGCKKQAKSQGNSSLATRNGVSAGSPSTAKKMTESTCNTDIHHVGEFQVWDYAKRFEREPFIINTSFLAGHNWPSACTAMPAARTFWLILPYTKSVFSSYFHHRIFFSYREFHVGMTS